MKKKSQKKETYIRICPKCKSPDVRFDRSNPLQPSMGLPEMYTCNKCNYSSNVFPEIKMSKLEKFEKEVNKNPSSNITKENSALVDTSYGNFEVRAFWKISAPITILIGIILLFNEVIYGIIITLLGIAMFYITYFKKRKLKED